MKIPEGIIRRREKRKIEIANFIKSLDEVEKLKIVVNWVSENSIGDNEKNSEAQTKLSMCITDLELGWEMILRIFEQTNNKTCLSKLGCWYLEDWLAIHRGKALNRVEELASNNLKFAKLLSCVYQNDLSNEEYERVKAVALYDR